MARIIYTDMSGVEQTISIDRNYPVVTIGRAVDCDIRSNRKSVSRHHAEFKFSNNEVQVVDLNSSNGTFIIIDDQRRAIIGQQTIADNDEVWCGDFVLRYLNEDVPQEKRPPVPTFTSSPDVSFSETDRPTSGSQPLGLGLTSPPQFNGAGTGTPPSLLDQGGLDPLSDDIDEIERLMAEKSSVEDLATRQAKEIDRLESLIENVKEDAASSVLFLKNKNEKTEEEKEKLKEQLDSQKSDLVVIELENEVVDLSAMNDKLRLELSSNSEELKNSFERELNQKNAEIDEIGRTNEQLASINKEVSRKLEDANAEIQTLKSKVENLNEKLSTDSESLQVNNQWESKFSAVTREKDALKNAHDLLAEQSEDQKLVIADLNDTVLLLEREKEDLSENIQSKKHEDSNEELVTFLTSLARLTDAIERTDFSVLSTVDRVRLQSAIRETKPKSNLQAFIEKRK